MEYCLRRLKRCTILTEGRPHSWNPCSSPLHSYIVTKYTLSYIANCAFTGACKHTEGVQANLLFKYLYAHTFLVHIAFLYYANMSRERGKKEGREENEKKGGRACRDKDSSAVLPSTHLHNDPLSWLPRYLIQTHTLTHARRSHRRAVKHK